jgi:hypothetical protein
MIGMHEAAEREKLSGMLSSLSSSGQDGESWQITHPTLRR